MKPELEREPLYYSPETIEATEELRDISFSEEDIYKVQHDVDYSEGESGKWYPKGKSPILAELVDEGKLPPVAERVGPEPVVIQGNDGLGNYGGTWNLITNTIFTVNRIDDYLTGTSLVRWSPLGDPIVPHIAKRWEVSPDKREWIFYLRKGMKWSDGHPFTGDDVHIENCVVHDIARLGIHIRTGSQRTIVKNCKIRFSGLSEIKGNSNGLHLCYSAQHGIYDGNEICDNHYAGISIGHKDGDNQFINNIIRANGHVGITYRKDTYRAYNNIFKDCLIEDNGHYGFYITGDAHHTTLEKCTIRDTRPEDSKTQRVGVFIGNTEDVVLNDCNVAQNCEQDIVREGNVTSNQ